MVKADIVRHGVRRAMSNRVEFRQVVEPYGLAQAKFAASSVLPLPLYRATCG
jgi:hypothetical protein